MLLYFDDEHDYAQRLAAAAGRTAARIERHRFPDGELKLRLPARLPPRAALLRSLHQPNEKLLEVMLAARAARGLGAVSLTLVAPYLAYMRQDTAFAPGEAVSQRIVGDWLAQLFDGLLTIDPHLHRVQTLRDAVPLDGARALSAAPLVGAALRGSCTLMLGPDAESEPWVRAAADAAGCPAAVCHKLRRGDREVEVVLPDIDLSRHHIGVVDDMASTGRTLAGVARLALAAGARQVDVAITHALLVGDAETTLREAGVSRLISTDSVPHSSNRISTVGLVAEALGPGA